MQIYNRKQYTVKSIFFSDLVCNSCSICKNSRIMHARYSPNLTLFLFQGAWGPLQEAAGGGRNEAGCRRLPSGGRGRQKAL